MNEIMAANVLVAIFGGAVGARISGAATWKGSLVVIAAFAATATFLHFVEVDQILIALACLLLSSGIAGGALSLKGSQIGSVIIGAVLGLAVVAFAVDSSKYFS